MSNQKTDTDTGARLLAVPPPPTGSASMTLVSEETFRYPGSGVNKTDNMVRVIIDMPRNVWWTWKPVLFPPNVELRDGGTTNENKD